MKGAIVAISACVLFLTVWAFAQNPDSNQPAAERALKNDPSVYEELKKAPEKARNRPNPLQNDPEAVAAGAILFEQHCAECHGNRAEGSPKAPGLRAREVEGATPGTLFWVITNGVVRKKMPVWSKLPEAQRWQLVRYLKSLGERSESAAPKP